MRIRRYEAYDVRLTHGLEQSKLVEVPDTIAGTLLRDLTIIPSRRRLEIDWQSVQRTSRDEDVESKSPIDRSSTRHAIRSNKDRCVRLESVIHQPIMPLAEKRISLRHTTHCQSSCIHQNTPRVWTSGLCVKSMLARLVSDQHEFFHQPH
jgi:hypothetical protein